MKKLLFILGFLAFISMVSADFPDAHLYVLEQSTATPISSNVFQARQKHIDLCYSGNILSDISVVYYYTYFKRYAITHSPSYCRAMLDSAQNEEEFACAVGACTHQPHDMESHNEMIPYSIKHTFLPNVVIHPFAEQHLDNYVHSLDPSLKQKRIQYLDSYQKCVPLVKRVLQGDKDFQGVNLDAIISKFIAEVQGSKSGYDLSFNNIKAIPPKVTIVYSSVMFFFLILFLVFLIKMIRLRESRTIFRAILTLIFGFIALFLIIIFIANLGGKGFTAVTSLTSPISNLIPIGSPSYHIEKQIMNNKEFFQQGEPWLFSKEADGITALDSADSSIAKTQTIMLIILVAVTIVIVYFNLRRRKSY